MADRRITRRAFVRGASAAAVAAPYVITTTALGGEGRPAASEPIATGAINIGDRGG